MWKIKLHNNHITKNPKSILFVMVLSVNDYNGKQLDQKNFISITNSFYDILYLTGKICLDSKLCKI